MANREWPFPDLATLATFGDREVLIGKGQSKSSGGTEEGVLQRHRRTQVQQFCVVSDNLWERIR